MLAYGNARELCMGLEVVLADGRIWNGLRQLRKDNTGYDLKNLFIGAEGTLGIITAAVLKLFPLPAARATAFLAVPGPEEALALLNAAKAGAGGTLTTFELMSRLCLEFVLRHAPGTRDPLSEPSPWYVLMEVSSQSRDRARRGGRDLPRRGDGAGAGDGRRAGRLARPARRLSGRCASMLSEVQTFRGRLDQARRLGAAACHAGLHPPRHRHAARR